ncbi:MAG: GAF domain-containing protein [Ferruginibacter sp.]|nr:GAF domain-containing protein [Cytophagales bacterium]
MSAKKFNISIGQRITGGFLILIVVFTLNAGLSIYTVSQSGSIIQQSWRVINPSRDALSKMKLLVTNAKMYGTNWVFLPSNTEDKEALKRLHETDYPRLKNQLDSLKKEWRDTTQVVRLDSIFSVFEAVLLSEKRIMDKMVTFENYEDPEVKFEASNAIDSEVLPKSAWAIRKTDELLTEKIKEAQGASASLIASFNTLRLITISLGLAVILVGIAAALLITRSITKPIGYIKNIIQQLGKGELPQDSQNHFNGDEMGEMAEAVEKLVVGLRSTSQFAEGIGQGSYQAEFTPLSENDVLGNALIEMRNNLQKVAEDDKKRNWATEGMAIFGEILRKHNADITRLSDEIISNLVRYTKANQGGLFIVNDENEQEPYLYLAACYAWDKKKYLEQKVYLGDGLTGQAWQEKETTYLTEVPDQYIYITSGLGEANPRSILIVPLKVNEQVYGVVEIASFNEFSPHEQEFVARIAESIASTISTVKINQRTQGLLDESTQMTEQMRAQEEEMRQNMEELQATQEEMQRSQRDTQDREAVFYRIQCILETDAQFRITLATPALLARLKNSASDLLGASVETLFADAGQFEPVKRAVSQETSWSGTVHLKDKHNEPVWFQLSVFPPEGTSDDAAKLLFLLNDLSELQLKPVG